uniref:Uncharacterized protein n=1 Tax=Arundo donax TaxID=35708 RepID=A0A0A8YVT4_ARUDO
MRGTHAGNALYFVFFSYSSAAERILKYDLGTMEMTLICPPPMSSIRIALDC